IGIALLGDLTPVELDGQTLGLGGHMRFESYVGRVEISDLHWTTGKVVDDMG
ncbi:hypothetical protein ACLOJK_034240, partial [Asimina triloba]